jgi:hypothetical protein
VLAASKRTQLRIYERRGCSDGWLSVPITEPSSSNVAGPAAPARVLHLSSWMHPSRQPPARDAGATCRMVDIAQLTPRPSGCRLRCCAVKRVVSQRSCWHLPCPPCRRWIRFPLPHLCARLRCASIPSPIALMDFPNQLRNRPWVSTSLLVALKAVANEIASLGAANDTLCTNSSYSPAQSGLLAGRLSMSEKRSSGLAGTRPPPLPEEGMTLWRLPQ